MQSKTESFNVKATAKDILDAGLMPYKHLPWTKGAVYLSQVPQYFCWLKELHKGGDETISKITIIISSVCRCSNCRRCARPAVVISLTPASCGTVDTSISVWGLSIPTMVWLDNAYVHVHLNMCKSSALSFHQAALLTFHHFSEVSQHRSHHSTLSSSSACTACSSAWDRKAHLTAREQMHCICNLLSSHVQSCMFLSLGETLCWLILLRLLNWKVWTLQHAGESLGTEEEGQCQLGALECKRSSRFTWISNIPPP